MQNCVSRLWRFLMTALLLSAVQLQAQGTSSNESAAVAVMQLSEPLVVHKGPLCFCCRKWIAHLHNQGIETEVDNTTNMGKIKGQWGIPSGMHSCHTAVLQQKYVFEGHVPARYIRKYLSAPPEGSFGLTVPGMPEGSPGMYDGRTFEPYNIYLLMHGGDYRFYARVEKPEAE
jgi:hypothetical protein